MSPDVLMLCLALGGLLLLSAPLFLLIGFMTALGYVLFDGAMWSEIAFAESMRDPEVMGVFRSVLRSMAGAPDDVPPPPPAPEPSPAP